MQYFNLKSWGGIFYFGGIYINASALYLSLWLKLKPLLKPR